MGAPRVICLVHRNQPGYIYLLLLGYNNCPKRVNTNVADEKLDLRLCYNLYVPTICFFDGIKISMFYDEHLPPHFHVIYSEDKAVIGIDSIAIIEGGLARHIRAKVFEWAAIHQAELRANWELARGHRPLIQIAPLD